VEPDPPPNSTSTGGPDGTCPPRNTGPGGALPPLRRAHHRRARPLALSALILLSAGACTYSSPAGPEPSTIAPGSPWLGVLTTVVLPVPVNSLSAVDCPTDTSCLAVGSTVGGAGAPNGAAVIATANGGDTWTSQVIPPAAGYLSGISCRDQRDCLAVGQATQSSNGQAVIIATTDGGRSWQARPVPPGFLDITAVSCGTDHRCIAVGDVAGGAAALTSASAGSAWVLRGPLPPGVSGATDVSCADDTHCWVTARRTPDPDHVAGVVALTTDGGSTWTVLPTPAGLGYLNGISCLRSGGGTAALPFAATSRPSTTAAPAGAPATTPGVATAPGSTPAAPAAPVPVVGVAGAHCTVVGTTSTTLDTARSGHGVILTTANGGTAWSNRPVPTSSASLMGVSCTGVDSCVMVGSSVSTSARAGSVILTGQAGNPWKSTAEVDAPQPLTGVSCVSHSRCVMVGESISEHLVGG
jgi:hypothetical protein